MKYILLGFLFIFFSANASAAKVPLSWYALPENSDLSLVGRTTIEDETKIQEELGTQLDTLFSSQTSVLEQQSIASPLLTLEKSDRVPWRFVSFMVDLGLTTNGKLGALAWKGTPAVSVYWMKKENLSLAPVANIKEDGETTSASVLVSAESTPADVDSEINSAINAAMASHKISSEPELRKNFREAVLGFTDLAAQVDAAKTNGGWEASKMRVDLSIEASGKVSFSPSAGAALRIRLEWFKVPNKKPALARLATNKYFQVKGLEKFMLALSHDLEAAADLGPSPGIDLVAKSIRVGLGVSVSGNVGLAKGTASAMVHVSFTKVPNAPKNKFVDARLPSDEIPLYMVDSEPSAAFLKFAQSNGNLIELAATEGGGRSALYKLDRAKFRKNIGKAVKIGKFFGSRAHKHETKAWKLKQIKTIFDVSLSGTIGIATVAGLASGEIVFENKNF